MAGYWPRSNCDHLANSLSDPFVRPTFGERLVSGENPGQLLARGFWSVHSNHAVNTSLEPCDHRVDVLSVITQSYVFIDIGLKQLKIYVDQRLNMGELQEKSDCLGHFQEQAIGNMERVTGTRPVPRKQS